MLETIFTQARGAEERCRSKLSWHSVCQLLEHLLHLRSQAGTAYVNYSTTSFTCFEQLAQTNGDRKLKSVNTSYEIECWQMSYK